MKVSESTGMHDVSLFVKRHTHDVRNALNGMEIELTLLDEFSKEHTEVKEAVDRLRQAATEIGRLMQSLVAKLGTEPVKNVPALQIAERWRVDAHGAGYGCPLSWEIKLHDENVWVNSSLVRTLLEEVLDLLAKNNTNHSILIRCYPGEAHVVMEMDLGDEAKELKGIKASGAYWSALRSIAHGVGIKMVPMELEGKTRKVQILLPCKPGIGE